MTPMRLQAATLLAVVAVTGCTSKVEVEYDREELRTAVRAEDGTISGPRGSRTRVRLSAERDVLPPPSSEAGAKTPAATTEPSPTAARHESGVAPPAMVITTIHTGDIAIRVGDEVHVHTHVRSEPSSAEITPPPEPPPRERSTSDVSTPATDPRCDRLMRVHEARVRRWETLFHP